jgi:hypothetical protein
VEVGVKCERGGRQLDVTMVVKTRRWRGGGLATKLEHLDKHNVGRVNGWDE